MSISRIHEQCVSVYVGELRLSLIQCVYERDKRPRLRVNAQARYGVRVCAFVIATRKKLVESEH
jgi:hypothetical protein